MAQKPSIPKGTRDFIPAEMLRRNYIFDTIREVYKLHGYLPIETPAMETLQTLMGKYGDEGDKLIYKILNSGDFHATLSADDVEKLSAAALAHKISERALRYDLTVPFARFVVMHQHELHFPFKRYQIQPVWRADRPQKGRYREFYQCDADVVGSDSLMNELELLQIIHEVFKRLNIRVIIKLNNRKILSGIAEIIGHKDKIVDITVAIDKLDKIGLEAVNTELQQKGIAGESLSKLQPFLQLEGSNTEKLRILTQVLSQSEIGMQGIEELTFIQKSIASYPFADSVELDVSLARGLNYYTGAIIEVKAQDVQIGSICGGGRYDNLTGIFGLPNLSGVGISFGADRIYDVLQQLDSFPTHAAEHTKVLFATFGEAEQMQALHYAYTMRQKGIACEVYPDLAKIKKQFQYAHQKNIAYVAVIGEHELQTNTIMLKNMADGTQHAYSLDECIQIITS